MDDSDDDDDEISVIFGDDDDESGDSGDPGDRIGAISYGSQRFNLSWIHFELDAIAMTRYGMRWSPIDKTLQPIDSDCDLSIHHCRRQDSIRHRTFIYRYFRHVFRAFRLWISFFLLAVWCYRYYIHSRTDNQRHGGHGGHVSELQEKSTLRFRETEKRNVFKIVQIADIHLGEAENEVWGPEQDRKTWNVLRTVLTLEAPVDLIVLSGDQLTANNCRNNATAYYEKLGDFLQQFGTPWAMIFGNHDDMDFEAPDGTIIPAKFSREDLLQVDQSFPLSLTRSGPADIEGVTNYVLDIHGTEGKEDAILSQIFLFDSGGGSIEKAITDSQLDWFRSEAFESKVPAVAFQHIPTKSYTFDSESCRGMHDDRVSPLDYDAGIVEALYRTERFFFLAVGHNHGNDYCCAYHDQSIKNSSMDVCYGRHSGYGGYGHRTRGCRVYELSFDRLEAQPYSSNARRRSNEQAMAWSSWIRLESGEVIDDNRRI